MMSDLSGATIADVQSGQLQTVLMILRVMLVQNRNTAMNAVIDINNGLNSCACRASNNDCFSMLAPHSSLDNTMWTQTWCPSIVQYSFTGLLGLAKPLLAKHWPKSLQSGLLEGLQ